MASPACGPRSAAHGVPRQLSGAPRIGTQRPLPARPSPAPGTWRFAREAAGLPPPTDGPLLAVLGTWLRDTRRSRREPHSAACAKAPLFFSGRTGSQGLGTLAAWRRTVSASGPHGPAQTPASPSGSGDPRQLRSLSRPGVLISDVGRPSPHVLISNMR